MAESIKKLALLAPIYNICYISSHDYILFSIGPYVHIYTFENKLISRIQVFDDHSIHGVVNTLDGEWILFGERSIQVYDSIEFVRPRIVPNLDDLILDILKSCLRNCYYVGYAHNFIDVFNGHWLPLQRISGSHTCVLFSMSLIEHESQIICSSGTAFGDLFLGSLSDQSYHLVYKANVHEGVVFRIRWRKDFQTFATTSDDRSVRLWESSSGRNLFIGWGHTSRVWDVCFIDEITLASCGEDGELRMWDTRKSVCLCTMRGHGKNTWRVIFVSERSLLVSGGNDGCLKLWDIESMSQLSESNTSPKVVYPMPSHRPNTPNRRTNGVNAIRVSDDGRSVVLVLLEGYIWWVTLPESSSTEPDWLLYANLQRPVVSSDIRFTDLGSAMVCSSHPEGWVSCVLDKETRVVWRANHTRVISVWFPSHKNSRMVLTSAAMGRCSLWNVNEGVAISLSTVVTSGETIASAALLLSSSGLVVGDTRGSISLFFSSSSSYNSEIPPDLSFRRIHGGEVVSCLQECANGFLSLGHDGFLNVFAIDDHSCVCINKLSCLPIKSPDQMFTRGYDGESLLIGGYVGSTYIAYDIHKRYQFLSCEAGGWRRPHHLALIDSRSGVPCTLLAYPTPHEKDHQLCVVSAKANGEKKRYWNQIGQKISSLELYCCCIITHLMRRLIVVGGEEGILNLFDASSANSLVTAIQSVEMPHAVPIKAVTYAADLHNGERGIIVACGGRLLYCVWSYRLSGDDPLGQMLRLQSSGSVGDRATQDHRILTVSALAAQVVGGREEYFLAMGDSRGHVNVIMLRSAKSQYQKEILCSEFPILCSSMAFCRGYLLLALGDSEGCISLWGIFYRSDSFFLPHFTS